MHTVLLSSIVVLSDLLVPMPGGGFSYNGSVYMPTPGGGWIWPEGTIQPLPGGGAWGDGWDTFPGLGAVLPTVLERREPRWPRTGGGTVIDPWAGRVPPLDPWGAAARPLGTWGHGLPMPATDAERCDAEEALAMKQLLQRRLRSLR